MHQRWAFFLVTTLIIPFSTSLNVTMKCHTCHEMPAEYVVANLPEPVMRTLNRSGRKGNICIACLRKYKHFGNTRTDKACSSDNYNCTSHTNAKRRNPKFNKLLKPPCRDFTVVLKSPAYAPLRSICNACYQRAKRLTSDPRYTSVSIPAEPINPTEPTSDSGESSTGSCSVSQSSSSSSSIIGSLSVGKRRKPAVKVAKRANPNNKKNRHLTK